MTWRRDDSYSVEVSYQGLFWQAYRGTGNDVHIKSVKFDGSDFGDIAVGGVTYVRPTIWNDYWHSFISVGTREQTSPSTTQGRPVHATHAGHIAGRRGTGTYDARGAMGVSSLT